MSVYKAGCLVCGRELVYRDEYTLKSCWMCGQTDSINVCCEQGHYICNKCHSLSAYEIISRVCVNSEQKDPTLIALQLMRHPAIKMHGPEHHFLVPAVLLSAYYNSKGESQLKEKKIAQAANRAEKILGGFCGTCGTCGAAMGTGIFLSLITDTTPLSKESWKLCNLITARSLNSIALHGGPRCCKRDTFLALLETRVFLAEFLNENIDISTEITCEFSELNKQCLKANCPFYLPNRNLQR